MLVKIFLLGVFVICVSAQSKSREDLIAGIYGTVDLQPSGSNDSNVDCTCVVYYLCNNGTLNEYGADVIDIRQGANPCGQILQRCCNKTSISTTVPGRIDTTTSQPDPSVVTPYPKPTPPPPPTQPLKPHYCGIRNALGFDFRITGHTNEAEYGEFPWMVSILKTDYIPGPNQSLSVCGGSLLAPKVVLTGAHCVHRYKESELKVRAGEWDTQNENEKDPYQERRVAEIIIHEDFRDGILHNNMALLVLDEPFKAARHIGTICLPNQDEVVVSKECYTTGWGKTLFGKKGEYSVILKKIDVPTVPHDECQDALRKTRLGEYFKLHDSFTCAGGIPGKDACSGDGGGPLACPDPNKPSRYVQVGIVAWGIGCATEVPGVYVKVAKYRDWVDKQMERLNLSNKPYIL